MQKKKDNADDGVGGGSGDLTLSEWVENTDCGILGQYGYDAYTTIDNDTVTTKIQRDKKIVTK